MAILFGDESKHILVKKHAVFIDNLDPHVLICYSESETPMGMTCLNLKTLALDYYSKCVQSWQNY